MIAASIVTYNTDSEELARCLRSLDPGIFNSIYVVDNSSCKATENTCRRFPNTEYIPSENIGYGAAHNIALRKSLALRCDYHLVLNPDIEFSPASIGKIIRYMDANTDIGALQPIILNPDGSMQYTVRLLPTPMDLILRRFLPEWLCRRQRDRYELRHIDHSKTFNVPVIQGSFMFLRCSAINKVGLFDERFFMYPEDIDLTRRIHRHFRTVSFPDVTVIHDHRAQSYHDLRLLRIHIVNMIRYFNKWGWLFDSERRRFNTPLIKK